MRLFTTKGTAKVFAAGVTGMGQEEYVAMLATGQASSQMGMASKD